MFPIKNGSTDFDRYMEKGHDSPLKRFLRGEDNSGRIDISVHYSTAAGSDPEVMEEIRKRLSEHVPFALKSENSLVVFVPSALSAYRYGAQKSFFRYPNEKAFVDGIKLQYLTHKELLSTELLLEISTTILCLKDQ